LNFNNIIFYYFFVQRAKDPPIMC